MKGGKIKGMCLRSFSFFTCAQIHLLGCDDRLLSHMASQSLAALVHFQLKEEVSVASLPSSKKCLGEPVPAGCSI